jgi:hypothetical protein
MFDMNTRFTSLFFWYSNLIRLFANSEKATDADEAVVKALGAAPPAEYAHAAKWYTTVAK